MLKRLTKLMISRRGRDRSEIAAAQEAQDIAPYFDVAYYLEINDDVREAASPPFATTLITVGARAVIPRPIFRPRNT
jgi:hypothetical protein